MIGKTRVESQAARAAQADVAERGQRPGRRPAQRVGNTDKVSLPPSPATGSHRLLSHSGQSSPLPATCPLPVSAPCDQYQLPVCCPPPPLPAASTATAAQLPARCPPPPLPTAPPAPRSHVRTQSARDLPRAAAICRELLNPGSISAVLPALTKIPLS